MKTDNLKTVLITGATEGFGWEFCKIFSQEGFNIIMVAREEEKLSEKSQQLISQYQNAVDYFSVDLALPGAADLLYNKVKQRGLEVDVLVNNAGVGEHGLFSENELQKELDVINLNVVASVHLTKLYLKDMIIRGKGKILQLSSILGMIPTPKMAVYAASKAFVLSFTEALQRELKDSPVTITVLCPGASDTEFFDRSNATDTRVYQDTPLSKPEEVAKEGFDGLMAGKNRVVPGLMNKVQAFSSNLVPDSLLAAAMGKLMEEKK